MDVDMNKTQVWQQNLIIVPDTVRTLKYIQPSSPTDFLTFLSQGKDVWEFIKLGLTLPPSPSQRSLSIPGGGNHLVGCSPPYYLECIP